MPILFATSPLGGDAIRADDDQVDSPLRHEVAGHVVGDQVYGIPSCCSSQAVRRAPCRNGRVSST